MGDSTPETELPSAGLYRRKALAKLSSPDRLDQLPRIVPPLGWLTLLGLLALLLGTLLWGFLGRIPTTVSGQGILLRGGKITSASALGTGRLEKLLVAVGDEVKVGQTVATVSQPTLETQIASQRMIVESLKARLELVSEQAEKMLASQTSYLKKQRASVESSILDYEKQAESLEKVVKAQRELLDQGLIPMTTLLQSQTQLDTTNLNILSARNQLQQLETNRLSAKSTARENVYNARMNLDSARAQLSDLESQLAQSAEIVSTLEGRVVGINVAPGQDVSAATRVIDIEETGRAMSAVLFFPAGQGKRVREGMTAQVSPDTTPVDQFGFILGTVASVADIPATPDGMLSLLSNEALVSSLSASGPQLQILATLETDPTAPSGFRWSSSAGPDLPIPAGTLASARVIVSEQPPITLVVPLLRKLFGIVD